MGAGVARNIPVASARNARRRARRRDPSLVNVSEDLQRLRLHETWLRERLLRAVNEGWSDDMIRNLANDLPATSLQLSRLTHSGQME
jgi:hypothetical protein